MNKLKIVKSRSKKASRKLYDTIPLLNIIIQLTEETDNELYTITDVVRKNIKSAIKDIETFRRLIILR